MDPGERMPARAAVTLSALALILISVATAISGGFGTPQKGEGTRIFRSTEHPYYTGSFHLSGHRTLLI